MGKRKDGVDHDAKDQGVTNSQPDYPIGYKKPPQHTQFKPGQSGNINGRPRKQASVTDVVAKQLNRIVHVNINGKPRRMSMMEAIAATHAAQAAKGDHKSASFVFNQLKPGEDTQNNNLPELLHQFRIVNASRESALDVLNISVEPERNLTTDSDTQAKIKDEKEKN